MGNIPVIDLWRHWRTGLAAFATMVVVFFWPAIPLRSVSGWLEFYYHYTPENYLYALLTLLSGVYVGLYVYNKSVCPTCRIDNGKAGAASVLGGVLLGACPACIPAVGIFLPLGVSVYLSSISWIFLLLAVLLLAFLIYRMNGFERVWQKTTVEK